MYGMEKWEIRPDKIKLVEYSLLSDQSVEFSVTEGDISDTKTYIKGSAADMESLLVGVENNVPKEERVLRRSRKRIFLRKSRKIGLVRDAISGRFVRQDLMSKRLRYRGRLMHVF